ncbi:MAG TPA: dihydroneopterin aldolase [Acidimicrobiales bacterium]|nr:dihydroneopterin aldolase [Acidimicrobiales bacterium]
MTDQIEVRGIRALGLIGLCPEELERPQPFEVDFDVETDVSVAGATDDLNDTLDYGALIGLVVRVVENEHHLLLERVASRLADELLAFDDRAAAVRVTIRKLRPPVPYDVATTAVTVRRRR